MATETIADRLRELLKERGMTPTQLSERLSIALPTVYNHLNGDRHPERPNIIKYADFFRVTHDYLVTGKPDVGNVTLASVVGSIGLGGGIVLHDLTERPLEKVDAPPGVSVKCSAARIQGDYLYPFREHWLVFWPSDHGNVIGPDCLGQLCVVQLQDGRLLLRYVSRGTKDGLYRLDIHNSAPIEDVAVEWAARVLGMTMPQAGSPK